MIDRLRYCANCLFFRLMLAAFSSRLNIVKELRHHGARYDLVDKGGSTAMHWAVDNKSVEVIKWMIKDGCAINSTDHAGWTPLLRNCMIKIHIPRFVSHVFMSNVADFAAAVAGSDEIAKVLIDQGAKLDKRDKDGKTALMIAVINNHLELCRTLINAKCDLAVQDEVHRFPLD